MTSKLHEIVQGAHDLAPSTRDKYLRNLDRWVAFASNDPTNWTRYKAKDFYTHLLTTMKPQSANQLMAGIAYASRWYAHYENKPDLNFARVQTKSPEDQKPQRALNEASTTALLSTCAGKDLLSMRDLALFVVGLETGMRRMSLISMALESTLFQSDNRHPYPASFVALKGQEPAWVPLSDVALMALRPWVTALNEHGIGIGPVFTPLHRWLAPSGINMWTPRSGKALSPSAIARVFEMRGDQAKLIDFHPHQLRHTFITWRAQAGQQPHEIASVTHHDITVALGALGGYMDMISIGGKVRNSTPGWLAGLVASLAA
jgi:integrase